MSRIGSKAHIAVLALLAAYFLVWPVWRVPFFIEIAWNEGWNAYFADAAAGRGTLYPSPDTLIVNNYPPLSFFALGWAQTVFGDALYIGRILSILATLGIGALVARIVMQLGAGRTAGALAGIWYVAMMSRSFSRFVGMNDPQLAGEFLMIAALSWFLARDQAKKSAVPPVLLMVVAGFWKHNMIAIPVTTLTWLLLRDGRRAIGPVVWGVGAALLGLALCIAIFGDLFVANLLTARRYRFMRVINMLGHLQFVLPALAIWALWAWNERRTQTARFTALFVAIALLACVVQWSGEAILDNAQFDLVIATAIGLGLAYEGAARLAFFGRHNTAAIRTVIVLVLCVRLLATARVEPFLVLTDPRYRAEYFSHAAIANAEVARVAAIPGPVACEFKIICRAAGKPYVYDDFRAQMLIFTGSVPGMTEGDLMRLHGLTFANEDRAAGIESLYRELFSRR